jgi:hypothetical protein
MTVGPPMLIFHSQMTRSSSNSSAKRGRSPEPAVEYKARVSDAVCVISLAKLDFSAQIVKNLEENVIQVTNLILA